MSLANELKCTLDAPEAEIDLTRAATLLARLEHPQLDIATYDQQIRGYAEVIAERLSDATFNRATPFGTIDIINRHLFDEVGLHGNEDDYYNPRNSFINEVLERRGGIPITLSVIYLEVARHLGLPIFGVALPGHFVVKYDDGKWRHFIDVFARGRVLDKDGCRELIRRLNSNIEVMEGMFAAVSKRAIIDRMLNNLRATYLHRRQYRKALAVLDVILALEPNALDNIRQRAWLRSETNQSSLAVADLEKYLKLCPKAEDADELRGWVQKVKRDLIALN